MKRIVTRIVAMLVCGTLLLVSNTAEARRSRWNGGGNYTQPVQTVTAMRPVMPTASAEDNGSSAEVATASAEVATASAVVRSTSLDTRSAQGVANIMASSNRVGHWGGNPGYEGCGCGATPAAAYSICCYGNSGMATVDVGYAQSASGMWFCCRRYR